MPRPNSRYISRCYETVVEPGELLAVHQRCHGLFRAEPERTLQLQYWLVAKRLQD